MQTTIKIPGTNQAVVPISVDVLDASGNEIGYVTDIEFSRSRRVERIRELSAGTGGRVKEQVPYVEDYTIRASGFALYTSTMIGRFRDSTGDEEKRGTSTSDSVTLGQQDTLLLGNLPFELKLVYKHPGNDIATYGLLFHECYITDASTPIRLGTITITETCTIQPSSADQLGGTGETSELEIGETTKE